MSKAYCPNCGNSVEPVDQFCRHCGHFLNRQQTAETIPVLWTPEGTEPAVKPPSVHPIPYAHPPTPRPVPHAHPPIPRGYVASKPLRILGGVLILVAGFLGYRGYELQRAADQTDPSEYALPLILGAVVLASASLTWLLAPAHRLVPVACVLALIVSGSRVYALEFVRHQDAPLWADYTVLGACLGLVTALVSTLLLTTRRQGK